MPWVKPCTDEEMGKPDIQVAVRKAIESLAKAGYKHDDLHWCHVGLYRKNSKAS